MNLTDHPLILLAAIFVGIVMQQLLAALKQRGKKTAYRAFTRAAPAT